MRWVILLGAMCAGCGAAVDEPAAPAPVKPAAHEIIGCMAEVPTAGSGECSFVAEAGQPYWAEATGDAGPVWRAEVCTDSCVTPPVTTIPGAGARVTIPAMSARTAVRVRFGVW